MFAHSAEGSPRGVDCFPVPGRIVEILPQGNTEDFLEEAPIRFGEKGASVMGGVGVEGKPRWLRR